MSSVPKTQHLYCLDYRLQCFTKKAVWQYKTWYLTFKALEGLKELSERLCGELFVVLGSHLDTDLQVLADVG